MGSIQMGTGRGRHSLTTARFGGSDLWDESRQDAPSTVWRETRQPRWGDRAGRTVLPIRRRYRPWLSLGRDTEARVVDRILACQRSPAEAQDSGKKRVESSRKFELKRQRVCRKNEINGVEEAGGLISDHPQCSIYFSLSLP